MTIELSAERALELMREVVAEYGEDHVYEKVLNDIGEVSCVYVDEGAPSCLVGHILHRAGMSLDELSRYEFHTPHAFWFLSEPVREILFRAQDMQDEGETWGDTLELAEAYASTLESD